jgi:hypothetical protein
MTWRRRAAIVYTLTAAGVVAFQLALAAGVPLGAYAMGGAYPGRFPPALRVAAVVQAALIVGTAGIIVSRAGLALGSWVRVSRPLAWVVVAVSAFSLFLNLITPSAAERAIWAPVALVLFSCSAFVATSDRASGSHLR